MDISFADDIFVRVATRADGPTIHSFLTKAARDENIDRFDMLGYVHEFLLPLAQIDDGQLFIATQRWTTIGLASVVYRQDGGIEIDALLIDAEVDQAKAGASLIAECRAFAKRVGVRELHATVNETLAPALTNWGFERIGIDEAFQGSVAVAMRMPV